MVPVLSVHLDEAVFGGNEERRDVEQGNQEVDDPNQLSLYVVLS